MKNIHIKHKYMYYISISVKRMVEHIVLSNVSELYDSGYWNLYSILCSLGLILIIL